MQNTTCALVGVVVSSHQVLKGAYDQRQLGLSCGLQPAISHQTGAVGCRPDTGEDATLASEPPTFFQNHFRHL